MRPSLGSGLFKAKTWESHVREHVHPSKTNQEEISGRAGIMVRRMCNWQFYSEMRAKVLKPSAWNPRIGPASELHRAKQLARRQCASKPFEFPAKKAMVKTRVVAHDHRSWEELQNVSSDFSEPGRMDDVCRRDPMGVSWPDVAFRVNQGGIVRLSHAIEADAQNRYLDDAIVTFSK